MNKPTALLFDLDGTLWDAREGIYDALISLRSEFPEGPPITRETLTACMGKTMDEIARRFFPQLPLEESMLLMERFYEKEHEILREKGGKLYPCVEEMLEEMSRYYPLFIVSNCQKGYIETFLAHYGFGKYISGHLCWGDTLCHKGENLRTIVSKFGLTSPVYFGDTRGDEEAARHAGMPFIYMEHGFGEVEDPDLTLDSFCNLEEKLKELTWR